MSDVNAGVVVVTKFCSSSSSAFTGYINYIDRAASKRNDKLSEYSLYNDYMDDPEKATGLFTNGKTKLSKLEKLEMKQIFSQAQENGSLMWQTVISFDNRWLEEHGLYSSETEIVDERKLKEIATGAVNRMLENEKLEGAIWTASIHYNTDNLHIHIATVEPIPTREQKSYKQYEYVKDENGLYIKNEYDELVKSTKNYIDTVRKNGAVLETYRKDTVLDEKGNPVYQKEYKGRFKGKSIELCKKYVVDEILNQREYNIDINRFIREQIIKQKQEHPLLKDADLKDKFMDVYQCLPRTGNRGLWNYNNNAMAKIRPLLDDLSDSYIEKYHAEDYRSFLNELKTQSDNYKTAYGKNGSRDFMKSKIKELHERLGNQILKEMREYDKRTNGAEYRPEDVERIMEAFLAGLEELRENQGLEELETEGVPDVELEASGEKSRRVKGKIIDWSGDFKSARKDLYGTNKDYEEGLRLINSEMDKGNILAFYEAGNIYKRGIGVDIDLEKSEDCYKEALDGFIRIYENQQQMPVDEHKTKMSYLEYRIGKQYYHGIGTEKDYEKAMGYLKRSARAQNQYAAYIVGNMYYRGEGIEKDVEKAATFYNIAAEKGNPYANYMLGKIHAKNEKESQRYYKSAFEGFLGLEAKTPDANTEYKLGVMKLKGLGVEQNKEEAEMYFKIAAENGNEYAQFEYAKLLLEHDNDQDVKRAIRMLKRTADKGNTMAQYALGKLYAWDDNLMDEVKAVQYLSLAAKEFMGANYEIGKLYADSEKKVYDMEKAVKYFTIAADAGNEYAQYKLGKIYADKESSFYDVGKAVHYLTMVADAGNEYAQYKLGKIYADKESGVYDAKKTEQYFSMVADAGNQYAQYSLAKLYLDRESEIYDPKAAIKYYEMASAQGNEYADLALGFLYLNGEDVPEDRMKAKQYFEQAAAKGNEVGQQLVQSIDKSTLSKAKSLLRPAIVIRNRGSYEIERALKALQYSFETELQKAHVIRAHEQLLEKEQREKEQSREEQSIEEEKS